ncbi:MAG: DUF3419 family protein [Planctomycetota bacterium]
MSPGEQSSAIETRADFSAIRYAQVWEDADVLLAGLDIKPGDRCLSIASAGDNALAMLTADPSVVVAVDLSPAQLACLGLRIAAYRVLTHQELLALVGSRPHDDRWSLYERCRDHGGLSDEHTAFWNGRREAIARGIGSEGKFERYFTLFRRWVLPLVHSRRRSRGLLAERTPDERRRFYEDVWDTARWRLMFRLFFSRAVMGRMGRDPEFFRYVDGSVGPRILERAKHAMTELSPHENPYMHWILTGTHGESLPLALREEHFETIRSRLDRLVLVQGRLEDGLAAAGSEPFHRFNLSDIFEYMSESEMESLLASIVDRSTPGTRLAYWNMLVPRSRPASLQHRLRPLKEHASTLLMQDKAFFYARFVLEEAIG